MVYLPSEKVSPVSPGSLSFYSVELTSLTQCQRIKWEMQLKQNRKIVTFKNNLFFLSADWSLEALLYKWGMKCVHIPLASFDADRDDIAESALPGRHTVEMLVISFAKDSLTTPTSCFGTVSTC